MATNCPVNRSIGALVTALAVSNLLVVSAAASAGQKPEVQRLFQSGSFDQAVEAAQNGDPATTYVAAQAMVKGEQPDRAREQFARLRASDNQGWRLIAESGEAMLANDSARAATLAKQATEAAGDNPFAFYQLGLSASKGSDWGTATAAFGRTLEIKPDFAYAHYYAALGYQRMRQLSKTAEHFDAFLRLAPDAPERQAVQAIMRTLK
jgi:tetratricopeptide (TPR) repeat protein